MGEGLQIPPVKLIEAGQPNQMLLDILARNVRVPEQTLGDLWGQVAACRMLSDRVLDLSAETGIEVEALSQEICSRSERVLCEVASDRVQAAPGSPLCSFTVAGMHQGRPFSTISFVGAGQGGAAPADGLSMISFPGNVANTPIEVMEANAPILVLRRAIRRGSGGRGAGVGGDGQSLELALRADEPAVASFIMNRYRIPAPGLAGGDAGTIGALSINGTNIDPAQH